MVEELRTVVDRIFREIIEVNGFLLHAIRVVEHPEGHAAHFSYSLGKDFREVEYKFPRGESPTKVAVTFAVAVANQGQ